MIPGEGPAGRVGPVHPGGEAHDQKPRLRIAERRYRCRVVARVLGTHPVEVGGEPGATPAVGIEHGVGPGRTIHEAVAGHEKIDWVM
jgi:hypothetical protein